MRIKLFILSAAMLVAFAACNKTETLVVADDPCEIGLNVVASTATKPGPAVDYDPEYYGSTLDASEHVIYVAASSTSQPWFLNGQLFSYIDMDDTWLGSSDPGEHAPVYWPAGGESVDFLAYALKTTDTGLTVSFGTNPDTPAAHELTISDWNTYDKQYDVMYAVKNGQKASAAGVAMDFKHAQALLSFTAEKMTNDVDIVVKKITVKDLEYAGTFCVYNGLTQPVAYWEDTTHGDKSLFKYDATLTTDLDFDVTAGTPLQCARHLLIPEQTSKVIAVTYEVNGVEFTTELNLARGVWKMGYVYEFNLRFNQTEIEIEPSVSDWEDIDPYYYPGGNMDI